MDQDQKGAGRTRPGRRRLADDPVAAGLRRLWADVEAEPVPDSFLDLLDRFDSQRRAAGPAADAGTDRKQ